MTFNHKSFLAFCALFITEVTIALFVKQPFVRYWFGDFLIVIMIYYFLKSFIKTTIISLAIFVLLFSFAIEFLQLTSLLDILDLRQHKAANLILGNTFSTGDLLAYTLGIVTVVFIEKNVFNKKAT